MSVRGIHRGFLRKYGGFMFKQWKERYLVLTAEGSLLVCRDADTPPDQVVALHMDCEAIVEGREILDLPRLPLGGRRDCCLALIMPQDKFLLLLTDSPRDCSEWLNMLRKLREGVSAPMYGWRRHRSLTPCITDRDPPSLGISDRDPPTPLPADGDRRGRGSLQRQSVRAALPQHSPDCLRHGNSRDARAVRAVCLLMGGAAASSALGQLAPFGPSSHNTQLVELPPADDLANPGTGGPHHACSQDLDTTHFHSFDCEGGPSFDAFDCGEFAF